MTARVSLGLLLGLNLFNFVDRYILAAVEPSIRATFFSPNDPNAMWWSGTLSTAFVVSYMISAPGLGWLADRYSRWAIIGIATVIWSLATAASGLAGGVITLFVARMFVGVGEGAYNSAAPPVISDSFPTSVRSTVLGIFFATIPIGSALGYVLGGLVDAHLGWRWAFYIGSAPGFLLGLLCFFQKDPRNRPSRNTPNISLTNYLRWTIGLLKRPSYTWNVAAQTAMAFALGGLAYWMPAYLQFRQQPSSATIIFGVITAIAGLTSTLAGGFLADRLRPRMRGSDLLVPGVGMLLGFPFVVTMLYVPFPLAWVSIFGGMFFIFFNTGPANTAVINVSVPAIRAIAFGLSILVMHAFGDAIAPPAIGLLAGHISLNTAFLALSGALVLSGVFWLLGAKYLPADMAMVEATEPSGLIEESA